MQDTRVKICGITSLEDARLATDLGAYAIGLIFAPSPRQVTPDQASKISLHLPPFVSTVGVFVNESVDNIRRVVDQCGLSAVQLHGDETPEDVRNLDGLRVIKAISVKDESSLQGLERWPVSAFLLDTYSKDVRGGTGRTFNWELASGTEFSVPVILSGGLSPENICDAVRAVRPYAVDVSSGVESEPGKKDPEQLRRLFVELNA